uniref:Deoxycytidylate deaminase n=1 Tax=Salmo trutta TaxID=8032 RepID=A0A674ARN1_SALTR
MSQEIKNEASQLNGTPASDSAQTKKREDYLEWPDYFMAVAFLSAQRSKDPSSQVGACIVNRENKIVGIGYNGMPNGCDDDLLPWSCSANDRLDTKYPYVCHAELNAIMNKNSADVKGCSMYVALFPCNECAKLIIQAGIKDVIYLSDKYHDIPEMTASRRLLNLAGIEYKRVTMQSDGTRNSYQRNLDG